MEDDFNEVCRKMQEASSRVNNSGDGMSEGEDRAPEFCN
ncbi:hypothetical protein AB54_4896 [Escherichia coli 2-011-08_S1_C3]|nr:hypothetical protein AB54_4896 [Escherichia coli 2-011-08_S1_C3]